MNLDLRFRSQVLENAEIGLIFKQACEQSNVCCVMIVVHESFLTDYFMCLLLKGLKNNVLQL